MVRIYLVVLSLLAATSVAMAQWTQPLLISGGGGTVVGIEACPPSNTCVFTPGTTNAISQAVATLSNGSRYSGAWTMPTSGTDHSGNSCPNNAAAFTISSGGLLASTAASLGQSYNICVAATRGHFTQLVTLNPTGNILPAPMLGVWEQPFSGPVPSLPTILANAPQYNHAWLFAATGVDSSCTPTGTDFSDCGALTITGGTYSGGAAQFLTDSTAWKATQDKYNHFRTVGLTIGPCHSGSTYFWLIRSSADIANAVSSIKGLVSAWGFQGIEWDIEDNGGVNGPGNPGPDTCYTQASIESVNSQLKSFYGNSFFIGLTDAPYAMRGNTQERRWQSDTTHFDITDIQYYAFGGTAPQPNCGNIQSYEAGTDGNEEGLTQFVSGADGNSTTTADRIAFGQALYYNSGSEPPCSPSVLLTAFQGLQSTYPALRGIIDWHAQVDQGDGWTYAATIGAGLGL